MPGHPWDKIAAVATLVDGQELVQDRCGDLAASSTCREGGHGRYLITHTTNERPIITQSWTSGSHACADSGRSAGAGFVRFPGMRLQAAGLPPRESGGWPCGCRKPRPRHATRRYSLIVPPDASLFSDAVLLKIDRFAQRFRRRGCVQRAVRSVLIVMSLVITQDPPQLALVPGQGAVQELARHPPIQRSAIAFMRGVRTLQSTVRMPASVVEDRSDAAVKFEPGRGSWQLGSRALSARLWLEQSSAVPSPGDGGRDGMAGTAGLSNISGANEFAGSQVGSQRGPASGDARPRPATEAAGERHAEPRPATPSDRRSVYGMQEVRSSSLRSSTFPQVRGHLC